MKITKIQLKQIIKEEIEGTNVISRLSAAIPEDYDIREFAKDIASIILTDYGSHNIPLFLEIFNQELSQGEG